MKRKITNILIGLLFFVGLGILLYPTVSNQWNMYRQNKMVSSYERTIEGLATEDFSKEWEKANAFNDLMKENAIYSDVFGTEEVDLKDTEYWKVLNVSNNGVMGYLTIPKINVELSIYHGVEESVLQTGIGHLDGTKLPIGGSGTHSVLAAHRGLPSARLFTDIDQLQKGDMFYIHVLDEVLAYQVDNIVDMVEKDDMDTLMKELQIVENEDYVTLFTCTPYGVNSHRLLVRGTRVPYTGEESARANLPESMLQAIQDYYMLYLVLALAVGMLAVLFVKFLRNKKNRKNADIPVKETKKKRYKRRGRRRRRRRRK